MFKRGDKVRIKSAGYHEYWYADHIGEVFTLGAYCEDDDDWELEEYNGYVDTRDIELVSQFDLKKNPWFIHTGTKEKSEAAQKWLFEQGINWWNNDSRVEKMENYILTNVCAEGVIQDYFMYQASTLPNPSTKEIILEFETVVKSVTYPIVETEQDKKIKELKETIDKAQQQLEELMGK